MLVSQFYFNKISLIFRVSVVLLVVVYLLPLTQKQENLTDVYADVDNFVPVSNVLATSNPLENDCKFPILEPSDPSIQGYVRHPRKMTCAKVQPEFTSMDIEGYLSVHEDISDLGATKSPNCFYQSFSGSLKPKIQRTESLGPWQQFTATNTSDPRIWIPEDQFIVKCYHPDDKRKDNALYKNVYAHFGDRKHNEEIQLSSENRISLDIIVLDSLSLNQFRRNMRKSWAYMTSTMDFQWLEGYNKVADNSMVNLFPVLAGLRYQNQSSDMESDILPQTYTDTQLNLESFKFLWNYYKDAGCVTMLNDDIGDPNRGLFHYPFNQTMGWNAPPTDYYFRPFYVANYRWPVANSSRLCFGNRALSSVFIDLLEQFFHKFNKKCHFSFNFLTDVSHKYPNDIETMDDDFQRFLERLYLKNQLNHSALVIMGDHGNRIDAIQNSFIGRLEERLPLFSIYLPQWLKKKHPQMIQNLEFNRFRLTSNFDVHKTLLDVIHNNFNASATKGAKQGRGLSLFNKILSMRTCKQADIPEQYCTCLVAGRKLQSNCPEILGAENLLKSWVLGNTKCSESAFEKSQKRFETLVPSQMVRHGIRHINKKSLKRLEAKAAMEIEYIEVSASIENCGGSHMNITARVQNERKYHTPFLRIIGQPLIVNWGKP